MYNNKYPKEKSGSLKYIAPEILLSDNWNFKADLWSLGVALAGMFLDKDLFDEPQNCLELLAMVQKRLNKTITLP
jgi:serine/threonine protein kinase